MSGNLLEKLEHMQIPVKNLDESAAWYVENLGFTLQGKSDEHRHAFLTLPDGPMLMLWETKDATDANFTVNGQTMPVLLYNTKQIRKLHEKLTGLQADITFFQDEGFGWVLKFIDLNGNMWGVIQLKEKG
ncbi:VOC family protein [Paenibacillus arenilitoris]|uniref:VOC family protein n=1 Tax=Paenibacillus arenilitoris TaxID=2772299 RepID=A0A927CHM2_9BACL|nr:VOC family protein [Paenibacillus arenilitoris]MBD2868259.1 VOC family protein [Paenibacillus arenilitoris]